MSGWFEVHKEGLAQTLERRGKSFAVLELIQNAWDEQGVTRVDVTLEPVAERRRSALLVVEDDAPDGFADLAHAWTLFAPSKKKDNAEQRGRWNLGEKLVLALCSEAEILSTTGGVRFDDEGRHALRKRRDRGSRFLAKIRFTRTDIDETTEAVQSLIVPSGIETVFNGTPLVPRSMVHSFRASLPTEIADDEGYLRPTRRATRITLYEPRDGETPSLYEMGIPVVETGDRYHVDIAQKVPLNTDRDNVRPAYLREVRTLVLNETFERLQAEDATETWVREALSDERIDDRAVEHSMTLMFGTKRVAYDPSDPESNKRAVAEGYTVVHGGALSRSQWDIVKRADAVKPAGQVTPGHTQDTSPDGIPPIDHEKWTDAMHRLADYTRKVGAELLGFEPTVEFFNNITLRFAATWGRRTISYNMGTLGKRWVEEPNQRAVDALILHEFAHHTVSDHLSYEFPDEIARLGAKLRDVEVRL